MNQQEDVEVILSHQHRYSFHSGVLARSSALLQEMLTEPNAATLNKKAKSAGIKIRWMIELVELPTDDFPAGRLELVELTSTGERADARSGMIVNENGRIPTKTFNYYEQILYAFYNKDITIADDDMTTALSDCMQMLTIAEYLGCVNVISKPIEVALMKHNQSLFRSIQSMPPVWAGTAKKIKSELIYREAIIHLAGNWRRVKQNKDSMERLREMPYVRSLALKYHQLIEKKAKALEQAVMSLYPGDLAQPTADLPIRREIYAKDILVWMALTFFRHWLGQRVIANKGYHGDDGGYELYRTLGSAGESYMDRHVLNQFHNKFPMTKKAMNVVENHLLEIKECVKGVVEQHGVLKSRCNLDTKTFPVEYLTCVEFDSRDLPWTEERTSSVNMSNGEKAGRRPGGNEIVRENLKAAKRAREERGQQESEDEDEYTDVEGNETGKRARHE